MGVIKPIAVVAEIGAASARRRRKPKQVVNDKVELLKRDARARKAAIPPA